MATNFAIRVIMDSAVVGADVVPELVRRVIQVLEPETLVLTNAATYTTGDRTYNLVATVT